MPARQRNGSMLIAIGLFKLLKAALLLAVALGLRRLLKDGAGDVLQHWARALRVDSDDRWVHGLIARLTGLSRRRLEIIGVGTVLYAALFAAEGVGLLLRKRWGEWLTVITTAGFLPLEIYEVVRRLRWPRLVVLALNVAILLYLIRQLARSQRARPQPT